MNNELKSSMAEGQPLDGTNCIHAETTSIFDLTLRSGPCFVVRNLYGKYT